MPETSWSLTKTSLRRAFAVVFSLALGTLVPQSASAASGPPAAPPKAAQAAAHLHGPKLMPVRKAGAAAGAAIATTPMTYQGGQLPFDSGVLPNPKAYVDFWGNWSANTADMTYITNFFTDLGGSGWAETMTQYCSGITAGTSTCASNFITNPASQLGGTWNDTTNAVPSGTTDLQVQAESEAARAHFAVPDVANAVIFVFTPHGNVPAGFGTQYCAYHSAYQVGNTLTIVQYALMPFLPDLNSTCWDGFGTDSGFSIVAGHEYAEAITDSDGGTGWYNTGLSPQGEIGDLCDGNHVTPQSVSLNGHSFEMQALFSNAGLPGSPCVFSFTPPTVPGAPTSVAASAGPLSATVTWSAPASNGGSPITGYRITPYAGVTAQTPVNVGNVGSFTVNGLQSATAYTFKVAATNAVGTGPDSAASAIATPTAGSQYVPVTPCRLVDTRSDPGLHVNNNGDTTLGGGGVETVFVSGTNGQCSGIPAGITAAVMNVTVANGTASSFLTIYPSGAGRPNASFLNWTPGVVIPNLVTVPVSASGRVDVFNFSGSVDFVMDLAGYMTVPLVATSAGLYDPLVPARILDTRSDSSIGPYNTPFGPGQTRAVQVRNRGLVPATGVSAAVLNVTVGNTTANSFLTLWPDDAGKPNASNVNWTAGSVIANRVTVKVGVASGAIDVFNLAGSTDVVIDVVGYYTDATNAVGLQFVPIGPSRLLDTRVGGGGPINDPGTPLGAGGTKVVPAAGTTGLPITAAPRPAKAIVINLTVGNPTASSFFTAYPADAGRPNASDLNFVPGQVIPNMAIVKLATASPAGKWDLYNLAGTADAVADLVGWYG